MMRTKRLYLVVLLLAILSSFLLTSCDVHEWPEFPDKSLCKFHLKFETEMPVQDFKYETRSGVDNTFLDIRYIVNVYPVMENGKTIQEFVKQLIFTRNITDNYDYDFSIDLPPGKYKVMVWSDLVEKGSKENYYYNADNFAEIYLYGKHKANTDNRDAFRGSIDITLIADILEKSDTPIIIDMIRPLGKFEFITTDLLEFVGKEIRNASLRSPQNTYSINLDDYRIVFFYNGFMPNAYSLFTDKPVDSATGLYFESKLSAITESEASMGFDYIFVNGKETLTTVVIGIFNTAGEQIGMTAPIAVPIKRGLHTIMKGKFLTQQNSGGVNINSEFDGNYNLFFP